MAFTVDERQKTSSCIRNGKKQKFDYKDGLVGYTAYGKSRSQGRKIVVTGDDVGSD